MSNEEKIIIKPTKAMLNHFGAEDYTLPLMLSEFIDNSISSWEKTNEKINGLKIEINFIENKINNSTHKEIQIKDNANGIDYYSIDDAGKFYDSTNKGKADLNQHGIGLKSSIGWLGKDGIIYSKTKSESQINVLKLQTSNLEDQDEWAPFKSQQPYDPARLLSDSGTTIIITNLNNDNVFDFVRGESEDKTSSLLTFLGWKYKHYIRNGLLIQLSFKMNDNHNTKIENYLVGDFDIKPWKLSDFINAIRKKITKNNSEDFVESEINEIIDNFKQSIKNIHDKTDITSIKSKVCEMILRDEEVFIEDTVIINDKNYKINYGIISPCSIKYIVGKNNQNNIEYSNLKKRYGYKVLQGISTFHHNRGIEIGPNLNDDFWKGKISETISFAGEDRQKIGTISTPIRLYGEIHINDLKTEINKAVLFWEDKESFISHLKNIWLNIFKDILSEMTKTEDLTNKKSVKLNVKSIQKITSENISKMKFDDNVPTTVDYSTSKDKDGNLTDHWTYRSFYKNQNYIFELTESKIEDKKPFKCSEVEANHYEIKYDFNHPIWHPINKGSNTTIRTLSHPIIVTLALAQWIIEDNKSKYINSINEKINIFDIIDEIVKKWEFKENDQ